MTKVYTDLGRTATKILDDDYSKGKFASVSSSAVDGLTGSVTSGIDASGTPSASFGYKMLLRGYEIACRFCSDGSVRAEALCSGLTERLKLLVSAEQSAKKGTSGKVNVVYKRRYVSSRVGLNTLDGTEADADVTLAYEGISFGVTTGYRFGEGKLLAKRATLCYTDGEESEVSVSICDQPRSVKGTYYHCVSRDFEVAAEAEYNMDDQGRVVTMGTKFCVDELSTVKAKFNSVGLIAACFVQQLNPSLRLALSTSINVAEFEQGHKFGIDIRYDC